MELKIEFMLDTDTILMCQMMVIDEIVQGRDV